VADLAARLARANREGLKVHIGGYTERAVTATRGSDTSDLVLSLEKLAPTIDHCAGDLVATVAAGVSLSDLNQVLMRGGQWLPIDPPGRGSSTIGAIVATNDSGPRRQRYGTPRDLIIGVEMALADGRVAKAGGHVVKNVAGYDLARLMCGSLGSLAVITSATFKLSPLPQASRTVLVQVSDSPASVAVLSELALVIAAAPLTPSAIELETHPARLLVRFETTADAADRQGAAVKDVCALQRLTPGSVPAVSVVSGQQEAEVWRAHETRIWGGNGTLLKICVLPTKVSRLLTDLDQLASGSGIEYCAGGRAALGVLYVRLTSHCERHPSVVNELRQKAAATGGSLVIASAGAEMTVDRWGDVGDALPLMRAVKARFDPKGTLNPGGGPGGL
jgi:glycolate oxidase FAD binding subunit